MSENLTIHEVSEIALGLMHQALTTPFMASVDPDGKNYQSRVAYLAGVDEMTRRLLAVMTEEEAE